MRNRSLLILMTIAVLGSGCAKSNKSAPAGVPAVTPPPTGTPYVPPGIGPGLAPGSQFGGTAPLTITNLATMSQYTGRPMNNPQNIKLNLNLVKLSSGHFGGTVMVTYTENGYPYQGYFTSGSGNQANKYNVSFAWGSQLVWHGVFEDFMGGLVVVIDNVVDLGDGSGPQDSAGGSIWFKNFGLTYAPHPPTYCWFVSLGPYDCRPWPSGDGMNTFADKDPTAKSKYIKLGTFTGLSLKAAFNNENPF